MTDDRDNQGRWLWQRLTGDGSRAGRPAAPEPALDAKLLAAWLDGSASHAELEQVERRLADDPDLLEQVLELRELIDAGVTGAPADVLRRAKSLRPAEGEVGPDRDSPRVIRAGRFWQVLRWSAAAAALVVAGIAGHACGRQTSLASVRARARVAATVRMAFDIEPAETDIGMRPESRGRNGGAS